MANVLMFHNFPWLQLTLAEPEQAALELELELVVSFLVENSVEDSAIFMPRKD